MVCRKTRVGKGEIMSMNQGVGGNPGFRPGPGRGKTGGSEQRRSTVQTYRKETSSFPFYLGSDQCMQGEEGKL